MLTLNYRSGRVAFSLVELMISLITISCIAAAFTPVITKKLKKQDVALSLAQTSEITSECEPFGFPIECKLCTKAYCVTCEKSCPKGQYAESKTCVCKNCSDHDKIKNDDLTKQKCVSCNNDGCSACDNTGTNEGKYYIEKGLCKNCPTTTYTDSSGAVLPLFSCDGITKTDKSKCEASESSGYFCDRGVRKACSEKYDPHCSSCNSTRCIACQSYYGLNTSGACVLCSSATNIGSCTYCTGCVGSSCTACTGCAGGSYFQNGNCYGCASKYQNCMYCNASNCSTCSDGYYFNSAKQCVQCTKEHCSSCEVGKNNYCASCTSGYYPKNGSCYACTSWDSNCVACDSTGCLSCTSGYHVSDNKKKCEANNGAWGCSDTNFMQVGDICVTRRNMGDASVLKIPSTVNVVNAGEICYATRTACCWKPDGVLSRQACANCSDCGSYDACDRTVCDFDAAYEICDKFNYLGVKWRLPTPQEYASFDTAIYHRGDNGLQLGSGWSGTGVAYSQSYPGCYGSTIYEQRCYRYHHWTATGRRGCNMGFATLHIPAMGDCGSSGAGDNDTGSVRCVTEMSNFK